MAKSGGKRTGSRAGGADLFAFHGEIIRNMREGVSLVSARTLEIIYTNPEFDRLLGYRPGELIGKHVSVVNAPSERSPKETAKDVEAALNRDGVWRGEIQNRRKDGSVIWCYASSTPIDHPDFGPVFLNFHRDISERKKAEAATRFRAALLDNAHDGIHALDADGNIVYCNDTLCRETGYTREELTGMNIAALTAGGGPPFGRPGKKGAFRAGPPTVQFEAAVRRKDGTVFPAEVFARAMELNGERLIIAVGRNIAERRKAEEDLRFRAALLDNANDWIHALDRDGRIIYCNDTMCRDTGYSREELVGTDIALLAPHLPSGRSRRRVKEIFSKGPLEFETTVRGKNGRVFQLEVRARPLELEGRKVVIAIGRNISERKRMESALKDSEANFRNIFDSALDGLLIADAKTGRFLMCNKAICAQLGYSERELLKLSVKDIHPESALKHVREQFDRQALQEIKTAPDLPVKRKDGSVFYADINSAPILFGGRICLLGNFRDVTDRRNAALAIKRSETLHRALIDTTDTGYVVIDDRGRVLDANRQYLDFIGYSGLEEIRGRSVLDWTAKHDLEKNDKAVQACARDGFVRNLEIDYAHKNGGTVPIEINATVMEIDGKPQILSLCRDISDRKKNIGALNDSLNELAEQKKLLEQKNIAFQEVIKSIELEKAAIKDNVARNVSELVLPILKRLKLIGASRKYLDLLQKNLAALTASFGREITERSRRLTPREIEICNMVKEGLTSKEISGLLGASVQTVDKHRKNIRKKLGLTVNKSNLAAFLRGLQ